MSRPATSTEFSAGGVVYRRRGDDYDIVIINRARYTDWSLPKGHIEEGESHEQTAVREVEEETGIKARVVAPLGEIVYFYHRGNKGLTRKTVYHFLMEAESDEFCEPNWEVAEAKWVPLATAHTLLNYANDRQVVARAREALGLETAEPPAESTV